MSGHCELAERTGATIYFGPGASDRLKFPHHEVKDGEVSLTFLLQQNLANIWLEHYSISYALYSCWI